MEHEMQMNKSENNKRIAKNTLLLYLRMLFLMVVGLLSSRIILQSLGVDDFGIYNVVGGIVILFSFLSGSLSGAIGRYLTFDLGKGDLTKLRRTFSSAIFIQISFSFVILLLAETIGLWLVNEKLVIPSNRIYAANFVYQLSIANFVINLMTVPYNASVISHEKMSTFAYVSIFEALGKLCIAYGTFITNIDKLIFYASGVLIISILLFFLYIWYCKNHFKECSFKWSFDKKLLKNMTSLAGWNSVGVFSSIIRDQGGNILINIFFGPAVNAARSIAMQVNTVLYGFVTNFMTALNPQITKNYANGNKSYMMELVFKGTRYSFYIMFLISLPVIINIDYILGIWLTVVPEHTSNFVRLILIFSLNELLGGPLYTVMLATGKTRKYQIIVGGCQTLNFPIGYLLLKLGANAESVFIIAIIIGVCCELLRIYMLRSMVALSVRRFIVDVYLNVFLVALSASIIPFIVKDFLDKGILSFIMVTFLSLLCIALSVYCVGLSCNERLFVKSYYKKVFISLK